MLCLVTRHISCLFTGGGATSSHTVLGPRGIRSESLMLGLSYVMLLGPPQQILSVSRAIF